MSSIKRELIIIRNITTFKEALDVGIKHKTVDLMNLNHFSILRDPESARCKLLTSNLMASFDKFKNEIPKLIEPYQSAWMQDDKLYGNIIDYSVKICKNLQKNEKEWINELNQCMKEMHENYINYENEIVDLDRYKKKLIKSIWKNAIKIDNMKYFENQIKSKEYNYWYSYYYQCSSNLMKLSDCISEKGNNDKPIIEIIMNLQELISNLFVDMITRIHESNYSNKYKAKFIELQKQEINSFEHKFKILLDNCNRSLTQSYGKHEIYQEIQNYIKNQYQLLESLQDTKYNLKL